MHLNFIFSASYACYALTAHHCHNTDFSVCIYCIDINYLLKSHLEYTGPVMNINISCFWFCPV